MIPRADIVQWREFAPWISDAQVEQDLIIQAFRLYLAGQRLDILKAQFRKNLALKVADAHFLNDTRSLLRPDVLFSPLDAARLVDETLIEQL